jgi:hypothetical protein
MKAFVLSCVLGTVANCAAAFAQDPGAMAAQQAMQKAIQANQQAIQNMQQASQLAQQQMQQAMQNAQDNATTPMRGTCRPTFSVPSGPVQAGTKVAIQCAGYGARIYYSIGGWMPTLTSLRYTGPISIFGDTVIQAMAVGYGMSRGPVARADYAVAAGTDAVPPLILPRDRVLRAGSTLRLIVSTGASSGSAHAGDRIGLMLGQDVKVGDSVLIRQGTPLQGTIVQAIAAGRAGTPGILTFRVGPIEIHGAQIQLNGGETLQGPSGGGPGKDAEIKAGMVVIAWTSANTVL